MAEVQVYIDCVDLSGVVRNMQVETIVVDVEYRFEMLFEVAFVVIYGVAESELF